MAEHRDVEGSGEIMSGPRPINVLVLDDKGTVADALTTQLMSGEISVVRADCADVDDVQLLQVDPSIVLIHAEGNRGLELCRSIWSRMSVPIVIACQEPTELCQLQAFAAGASDVVSSSSSSELLAARVWARIKDIDVHRRGGQRHEMKTFQGMAMDEVARHVTYAGIPVPLTRIEFEILALLMSDPDRVFRREEIIKAVWNSDWAGDAHMLESHVSRLRKKITVCGGPHIAVAVRGVGYRLCDAPSLAGAQADAASARQAGGGVVPHGLTRPTR